MLKNLRRLLSLCLVVTIANIVLICAFGDFSLTSKILLTILLVSLFAVLNVVPFFRSDVSIRLHLMMGGYELILIAFSGVVVQVILAVKMYGYGAHLHHFTRYFIIDNVMAFIVLMILTLNGFTRMMLTSIQLKILWRVALILTWWVPIVNLLVAAKVCSVVRLEFRMEQSRHELNQSRKENEICATRYPIVLVHGVFFRDWQYMNYWGRIPGELIRNGATVFYGKQQSAAAIADSAAELKARILGIISETNCGKVNIIAHSKGGLDSRYAVSCLGLDSCVASLTTINSPHLGCKWVDDILKKIPDSIVQKIARRYNSVFSKLGDTNPDFIKALLDLTSSNCVELNKEMPDRDNVYCQSVMSRMSSMFSDMFPLNIAYLLVKRSEGENDGLVSVESAKWGNFLGTLSAKGRKGISHGDIIDLQRRNLPDFDVREFYVNLVSDLKAKGF